jgi:hypothetical protein
MSVRGFCALSVFLILLGAPRLTYADSEGEGEVEINVGTSLAPDGDKPPGFLVEVEYEGLDGSIRHHDVRYFWIEGEFIVGRSGTAPGAPIDLTQMEINVTPMQVNRLPHDGDPLGTQGTFRIMPIRIKRELDLGLNASATVHVLGYSIQKNAPLVLDRLNSFMQVGIDLLGVQYLNLKAGGSFTGLEVGRVDISGGLAWNMTDKLTLRLSIGIGTSASVGNRGLGVGVGLTVEAFSKLELLLKTTFGHLSLFLASEYERNDLFSQANAVHLGDFEIKLGIGGSF